MNDRPRLVYVVTHSMTARLLLRGQLDWMQERGYDVTLVTSGIEEISSLDEHPRYDIRKVSMAREISPAADAVSLFRLTRELRRLRPSIVNASTPKAGLLGLAAARMAGVPVRIYTLRGLRLETTTGLRRHALTVAERLACASAHQIVCVSDSLKRRCEELEICASGRATVLGDGSSNGVEIDRFAGVSLALTERLRQTHALGQGPVVGFVGRLTRDKGVEDLRRAFAAVEAELPEAQLLLIGRTEPGDPISAATREWIAHDERVIDLGQIDDTTPYYSLMDVLALPSYREGMPNAPLEAAAAGVPTVGYRVTGTVDAVDDGTTGVLVAPGDAVALAQALLRYLRDDDLARRHGCAARDRVAERFRPERVWQALDAEYSRLLEDQRMDVVN